MEYYVTAQCIADALRVSRDVSTEATPDYIAGWLEGIDDAARALAARLASDNPRFDRARFLAACGVPAE